MSREEVAEGIKPSIYTHPMGYSMLLALPRNVGPQGGVPVMVTTLHLNTAYSIELNATCLLRNGIGKLELC